jgi:membrane associated rhomboid family serine protease
MIPLKDDNATRNTPVVTYAILGICVVVFLLQISSAGFNDGTLFYSYGVIPASLLGTLNLPVDLEKVHPYMTILTSMFMHGGWMHLIGNMLYLWIFADNIEDDLGKTKFILFYVASGAAAALTQVYMDVASEIPMVGASGAIGGVLGAYLILVYSSVYKLSYEFWTRWWGCLWSSHWRICIWCSCNDCAQ